MTYMSIINAHITEEQYDDCEPDEQAHIDKANTLWVLGRLALPYPMFIPGLPGNNI